MGDLDYVYAVARIRVKEKSLLTDMDISQMTALPDARAVLSYVEDRGWGDAESSGDADKVLAAEEKKTADLMRELKIDPSVFALLSYPNLYHNLKAGIKEICTSDPNASAFYPMERYGREEMLRILGENDRAPVGHSLSQARQPTHPSALQIEVLTYFCVVLSIRPVSG